MDNREAFSVREFCARYGICKQTFYDEIHRGRISAKKLGKKTAKKSAGSAPSASVAARRRCLWRTMCREPGTRKRRP